MSTMQEDLKPLVSVVIPGYKSDYILETIESILSQTYSNIEIIIIDDGSPNNLKNLLTPLIKNEQIRYIWQKNQKMASAKNNGIANARGMYIAFLDDDDVWLPEKIEKQVKLFEKDKDIGLVYSFAEGFSDSSVIPIPNFEIEERENVCNMLFLKDFIANSSVIVRKKCFEKLGVFSVIPNYFGVDDCDMWTRIAYHYKIDVVPEKLARIRIHENRYSSDRKSMIRNDLFVRKKLIKELNISSYYSRKYFMRIFFELGYLEKEERKIAAAKYYFKSFMSYPSFLAIFALIKLMIK